MAHRKAGGSAKSLRDSKPKYLGVKKGNNERVKTGQIIVRQRGTKHIAGRSVGIGKDHTLFARCDGIVCFTQKRKASFTGKTKKRVLVNIK